MKSPSMNRPNTKSSNKKTPNKLSPTVGKPLSPYYTCPNLTHALYLELWHFAFRICWVARNTLIAQTLQVLIWIRACLRYLLFIRRHAKLKTRYKTWTVSTVIALNTAELFTYLRALYQTATWKEIKMNMTTLLVTERSKSVAEEDT